MGRSLYAGERHMHWLRGNIYESVVLIFHDLEETQRSSPARWARKRTWICTTPPQPILGELASDLTRIFAAGPLVDSNLPHSDESELRNAMASTSSLSTRDITIFIS
ncbi:hypothetical protein LVJ94_25825 [Pendulispora rubella]|uniref:Uncharacterized protein n=1 Tax=Pendulispora rubella TaxID=2741070 RepID=A0ABZ2LL77_9BACT